MKALVPVVAAVVRRGQTFLVGRRPEHKRHGGLWEFPGGKMREGESLLDAVRRELFEELALATSGVGEVLYTAVDPGSPFEILFMDVTVDGEPQAREHEALRWATVTELVGMSLAPSDARFVGEYLARKGHLG